MNKIDIFEKSSNFVKVASMVIVALLNIAVVVFSYGFVAREAQYVLTFFNIVTFIFIAHIFISNKKTNAKTSWIIFLLIFPVFGLFLYLIFGRINFNKKIYTRFSAAEKEGEKYLVQDLDVLEGITDKDMLQQIKLVNMDSGYPVYKNTEVEYYPLGENFFESLIIELEKAEKFIFMQYFIVSDGNMHRKIMEILKSKAESGVEVFYSYDVAGSLFTLPKDFKEDCLSSNIKILPFNDNMGNPYTFISYRDHRKITVIDGKVGFTGGINIGDEYINQVERFGHWKDVAVKLTGDAVNSLSIIFLKTWAFDQKIPLDFSKYIYKNETIKNDTYVMAFDDGPVAKDVAENNYIRMIASAKDYVYICTPYLILSQELISAIQLATISGVDVRILTPHVPDKKLIFKLTQSFYGVLLEKGAKIYEYKPGFVHAKTVVVDDKVAFVGTINFDYRSLLWNFECGAWIYDKKVANILKDDYLKTLDISLEYTIEKYKSKNIIQRLSDALLQFVAPLM
ncbi:MAG: cardiolipin synthase [Lachnospirales bacterium]